MSARDIIGVSNGGMTL